MKIAYLVAGRDEMTGELGLFIEGMRRSHIELNAATDGALIAHDIIEHVNGLDAIGSINDELEALGAIWYVRGQHGDISRDPRRNIYSPEVNIASDVTRMFVDYMNGVSMPAVKGHSYPVTDDEALQAILTICDRDAPREASGMSDGNFGVISDSRIRKEWKWYRKQALMLMRAGYRKARRKWEPRGRFAANSQFWNIAEAVQPFVKPEYEGARYVLKYGNSEATCYEVYEEDT